MTTLRHERTTNGVGQKDEWVAYRTLERTVLTECGIAYRERSPWQRSRRNNLNQRKSGTYKLTCSGEAGDW